MPKTVKHSSQKIAWQVRTAETLLMWSKIMQFWHGNCPYYQFSYSPGIFLKNLIVAAILWHSKFDAKICKNSKWISQFLLWRFSQVGTIWRRNWSLVKWKQWNLSTCRRGSSNKIMWPDISGNSHRNIIIWLQFKPKK